MAQLMENQLKKEKKVEIGRKLKFSKTVKFNYGHNILDHECAFHLERIVFFFIYFSGLIGDVMAGVGYKF